MTNFEIRLLRLGLFVILLMLGAKFLSTVQVWGIDFGPAWAAARSDVALVYDFDHITRSQPWILGDPANPTLRPFVYPPPALLLVAPIAQLPFWLANSLWTVTSLSLFVWALRKHGAPLWSLLFTPVIIALAAGQATLLVGAMLLFGLRRGRCGGLLLGMASCLKPPLVLLLPLGLVAQRRWGTMVATGVTVLSLSLLTVALWGIGLWEDWFAALAEFHQLVLSPTVVPALATPYGQLEMRGLDGRLAWVLAPIAFALVWRAFASDGILSQLAALVWSAMLLGAYALFYELALLAPALARAFDNGSRSAVLGTYAFALVFLLSGFIAMLIAGAILTILLYGRTWMSDGLTGQSRQEG